MLIHHGKHHQAYVNNLNKALEGVPSLQDRSIEDLLGNLESVPEGIRTAVRNNGGGHYNHSLFWRTMGPGKGGQPDGPLAEAIDRSFDGFAAWKEALTNAAMGRFGSGWAWLVSEGRQLSVLSTANQDSPVMDGQTPILGIDVWEHAYYLNYQNRRPDYIAAWFSVIDWDAVAGNFDRCSS